MNGVYHDDDGQWLLCRYKDNEHHVSEPIVLTKQRHAVGTNIACAFLEEALERHFADETTTCGFPVEYPQRDDALLLHCQLPKSSLLEQAKDGQVPNQVERPYASIFGLVEDYQDGLRLRRQRQQQDGGMETGSGDTGGPTVRVDVYHGRSLVREHDDGDNSNKNDACSCRIPSPHSDWLCHPRNSADSLEVPQPVAAQDDFHMTWVDLRSWRHNCADDDNTGATSSNSNDDLVPNLASVAHFLRSLLGVSHQASPWCPADSEQESLPIHNDKTDVMALLLPHEAPRRLMKFRVSDICPSWALYSVVNLQVPLSSGTTRWCPWESTAPSNDTTGVFTTLPATLLVYRRLPPRPQFSLYFPRLKKQLFLSPQQGSPLPDGCLWESYVVFEQHDDNNNDNKPSIVNDQKKARKRLMLRIAAPPYISYQQFYHASVWQPLLEQWTAIRDEAKTIAHWTAWPERQHYSNAANDDNDDADPNAPPPWTVFPLCHCFPANDPSRKQWIDATCAFVPRTTQLLKQIGPVLRTALFSRLDPETTLEAHTGWADLANHVIRLHLPLVVPPGDLCGTWVDGCVETHAPGRLLLFDDSKVHRAFNYSREERIVLILDLARPPDLPVGTATGGHSDELDQFIAQMKLG